MVVKGCTMANDNEWTLEVNSGDSRQWWLIVVIDAQKHLVDSGLPIMILSPWRFVIEYVNFYQRWREEQRRIIDDIALVVVTRTIPKQVVLLTATTMKV